MLPRCTEVLGELLKHTSALKVSIGQFPKMCELDHWNGTVLNVAWNSCMYFCSTLDVHDHLPDNLPLTSTQAAAFNETVSHDCNSMSKDVTA
jgi:hypothetical protein